jgi:hypothetical protein
MTFQSPSSAYEIVPINTRNAPAEQGEEVLLARIVHEAG